MFLKNDFIEYLTIVFELDGTTYRLINNCIEFVETYHNEDFINKLYELLDSCFGLEIEEIEKFYQEV